MLARLKEMKSLTVHLQTGVSPFIPPAHPVNAFGNPSNLYPNLKSLTAHGYSGAFDYPANFHNLVNLKIEVTVEAQAASAINDTTLQDMITTLEALETLDLESCAAVTDFGITGIRAEDSSTLLKTKKVFLTKELSDFGMQRTGLPLSSLKREGLGFYA